MRLYNKFKSSKKSKKDYFGKRTIKEKTHRRKFISGLGFSSSYGFKRLKSRNKKGS